MINKSLIKCHGCSYKFSGYAMKRINGKPYCRWCKTKAQLNAQKGG